MKFADKGYFCWHYSVANILSQEFVGKIVVVIRYLACMFAGLIMIAGILKK